MSSYKDKAINPKTGKEEEADFLDDYFGQHQYGVKFEDGEVYRLEELKSSNHEH